MESTRTSISELPPYRTLGSDSAPPSYTFCEAQDRPTTTTSTPNNQSQQQPSSSSSSQPQPASSSTSTPDESSSSSSSRPTKYTTQGFLASAKDAYRSHRASKDAARKVQFYEQIYGFVPKNVMTEAEWKAARKKAPVVKKKTPFTGRTPFGPQ